MTKKELAEQIAETHDLSKAESEKIISSVFDEISAALKSNTEVAIPGFGKFSVSQRAARQGLNPRTREKITIPASKSAKFKSAKQLKETINN